MTSLHYLASIRPDIELPLSHLRIWLPLFFEPSSGTLAAPHSSIGCATLGYELFAEKRHASQRNGRLDGEDFMTYWVLCLLDTFMSFPIKDWHLRRTGNFMTMTNWPVKKTQSSLVMHLITTRLGANNDDDYSVRLKVCITWTSTAGLSGSTQSQLW